MNQNQNTEAPIAEKKKAIYMYQPFQRSRKGLADQFGGILGKLESPCRMLIEVFIRKDFGERYFRLPNAVGTFVFFALWPLIWNAIELYIRYAIRSAFPHSGIMSGEGGSILDWLGWYAYLFAFLALSIRHHQAQKRAPSVFDFKKYSLDSGCLNGTALHLWKDEAIGGRIKGVFRRIAGREVDTRAFECWIEPSSFFVAGLLLALIGQNLGWLLMLSAVVYALSYRRSYNWGDNHVMDKIDEMIMNKAFRNAFLDDSEMLGYRPLGRKPDDPEKRKELLDYMLGDEEEASLAE